MREKIVARYYEKERQEVLSECISCGLCIKACQVIEREDFTIDEKELQKKTLRCLDEPFESDALYYKAYSCMGCFKCMDNICPKGLKPMVINEIIKCDYSDHGFETPVYMDPLGEHSRQRLLASIQTDETSLKRILTKEIKEDAEILFFPGCNVYYQPDKLLAALDIMDHIGKSYSFLPGLDYCCGNIQMLTGDMDASSDAYRDCIDAIRDSKAKKVVFWCGSCICRLDGILKDHEDYDFEMITFAQYMTENMDALDFKKPINQKLAVHDACKNVYAGIDQVGPREVLEKIEGVTLVEKYDSKKGDLCCGISSPMLENNNMKRLQKECLQKTADTGADVLVDVCHTCHNMFLNNKQDEPFEYASYVNLIANALGYEHKDFYQELKDQTSIDEFMKKVKPFLDQSPFDQDLIKKEIEAFFPKLEN